MLLEALTFPRAPLSETVCISEQIMSEEQQKRKISCIYLRQMETIAYLEFRKLVDVFPFSSGAKPLFQHNV